MNLRCNKKFTVASFCIFILLQSFSLMAEPAKSRGKVLNVDGDVEVVNASGEKRTIKKAGESLNEMDTIVTHKGGSIIVEFDDGALSVLNEESRLRVEKTRWFSYLGGKIYFTFKKVFGQTRHVKTASATIGVRGTTFIIGESGEGNGESVALKEGLLDIVSIGKAFEIHKKKTMDEFERFKQEQQAASDEITNEFEQYKNNVNKEFVEYKKQFTLQPNQVIHLSGNRVDETAMTESNRAEFIEFEKQAEEYLNTFRKN